MGTWQDQTKKDNEGEMKRFMGHNLNFNGLHVLIFPTEQFEAWSKVRHLRIAKTPTDNLDDQIAS